MAKPSSEKRRRGRKKGALLMRNGLVTIGLGIGMLTASAVLGAATPIKAAVSTALSMPAWWAIGIGLALMAAHGVVSRRNSALEAAEQSPVNAVARLGPEAILDLIDQAERAFAFSQIDPSAEDDFAEPVQPAQASRPAPRSPWGPAVFAAIEWRRFEAMCEALFSQGAFEARSRTRCADGGLDIWLHSRLARGQVAVVRCQHGQSKPVGMPILETFLHEMAARGLKRGTYVTSSSYTPEARAFATAHGINALDGPSLLALIEQRTPQQQTDLLAIAFEGEYWRPTCAKCGLKMVGLSSRRTGQAFWGCASFPSCRHRLAKREGPLPH
jgi:restriction system protein